MPDVGLILLAAGASSRMGQPKQLLPLGTDGSSLLRHVAEAAAGSVCRPIMVVLGYEAERMLPELDDLPVQTTVCADWERGMGASIRAGLQALESTGADLEAAVIMLCDQAMVTSDTIDALVGTLRVDDVQIVASEYGDAVGTPAIFARPFFAELAKLPSATSANQFIEDRRDIASRLIFPGGAVDIDTPDEYNTLQREITGRDDAEC